jgi:hypothetical protein
MKHAAMAAAAASGCLLVAVSCYAEALEALTLRKELAAKPMPTRRML